MLFTSDPTCQVIGSQTKDNRTNIKMRHLTTARASWTNVYNERYY